MTNNIKNRIEQVRSGIVPDGYKKTKVGIIPIDWEVRKLGEVASKFDYGMNSASKEYDGENKYIRITDIDESSRKYLTSDIVSPLEVLEEKYLVSENDILFARTGASVGKTYVHDNKHEKMYFAGFLIRANINENNCTQFIFNQTLTLEYGKWVKTMSMRSGQPGINAVEYQALPLPIPPLPEQQKIADILTTQDKVIELCEKRIEQKEKQKKYLMQTLLTGKKRLNGFSDEWESVFVENVFETKRGNVLATNLVKASVNDKYKYPVYSSQTKHKGLMGYYTEYLFKDAITWTTDGANAGQVNYREGKFYCTNVCGVLTSDKGYANQCIAEILNSCSRKYVSYVGNPKLMNNVMEKIKITIPHIPEQKAISEVLSTADKEIELLKRELEQEKEKKKSLMQLLLTGIVRV